MATIRTASARAALALGVPLALALLAFAALPAQAANQAVTIQNFAFSPATVNVTVGDTVTWTNQDSTAHTVTSDTGAFGSGNLNQGQSFSQTFSQAGTFAYHCAIHPTMTGTVVVAAAAATTTPAAGATTPAAGATTPAGGTAAPPATGTGEAGDGGAPISAIVLVGAMAVVFAATSLVVIRSRRAR